MKLREQIDMREFLKQVKMCEDEVYLCTLEGDRLNLKSMLSQYVFVVLADQKEIVKASRLECSREDSERLKEYVVQEE